MKVPYTTKSGVRIGLTYTAAARPHHDADALRLQRALISQQKGYNWSDALYDLAFAAGLVALAAAAGFAIGFFSG